MPNFDKAWDVATTRSTSHSNGEQVSPHLRHLVKNVYDCFKAPSVDLPSLHTNLEILLSFLATDGRTNANCWTVDLFFTLGEGWKVYGWGERTPEPLHDIIVKMTEALHDTVKDPEIARNFGCLPEQLLEDLRTIQYEK